MSSHLVCVGDVNIILVGRSWAQGKRVRGLLGHADLEQRRLSRCGRRDDPNGAISLLILQMLQGMCLEGLQDLLMQYLELRVGFTSKDQAVLFMLLGICSFVSQLILLPSLLAVASGVFLRMPRLLGSGARLPLFSCRLFGVRRASS